MRTMKKQTHNRPRIEYIKNISGKKLAFNRYKKAIELLSGRSLVLDCACGSGYGSAMLASNGKRVVGVDISLINVKHAKRMYGKEHTKRRYGDGDCMFVQTDAASLPLKDDIFDSVCSIETIEHLEKKDHKRFLNELKRVMKPNGALVISTPNKGVIPYLNPEHVGELTEKEFDKLLSENFESVEHFCQGVYDGSAMARSMRSIKTALSLFGLLDEMRSLLPGPILSRISARMRGNSFGVQKKELARSKPVTFYSKCEKPKTRKTSAR